MSFEKLNVKPHLARALAEMEIVKPTQIQQLAIPLIQSGKDVIGISKTGSGKTAAFGIPILERLGHGQGLQALIVVPTRELACQISDEIRKFSKYQPCTVATIYGGVSFNPQVEAIKQADLVVGTPGRLVDHLTQHTLSLSRIRYVVLDEADKMVEMGFIQDIRAIMEHTPNEKQVMLFGATISDEIDQLKRRYMHEPRVARAESRVKQEFLKQYYYNVEMHEKFSLLVHLLKKEDSKQAIVFCSKRSTVDILTRNLRHHGIMAESVHGKLNQATRLKVVDAFRKGSVRVLVASAVAARGLDFRNVTHIFNYDLSRDPQEYIHRVGRTARAGDCGKAITLLSSNNYDEFTSILRNCDVEVEVLPKENFPRLHFEASSRDRGFHRDSRMPMRHMRDQQPRSGFWQRRAHGF
jgi:superfamily II DNA/RNA helicase